MHRSAPLDSIRDEKYVRTVTVSICPHPTAGGNFLKALERDSQTDHRQLLASLTCEISDFRFQESSLQLAPTVRRNNGLTGLLIANVGKLGFQINENKIW